MPSKGVKDAGTDSLPTVDSSAEVTDTDYKDGQRRKSGQDVETDRETDQ